jgi:hypothetical protein
MPIADQTNLIVGTIKFLFNATLPGSNPDQPASYTTADFGELLNGNFKFGGDTKESFDSVGGVLYLLKTMKTKRRLDIEADIQKLSPSALAFLMGSASGSAPTPGLVTEGYGWLGIQQDGEPIVGGTNSNKGTGILVWYGFACGIWIDGDLKLDGDSYATGKLHINAYLARARGIWLADARPVVAIP